MGSTSPRVDELFNDLVDLSTEERARALEARCKDPALRDQVERLLSAHDEQGDFLATSPRGPTGVPGAPTPDEADEASIGPYRLLEKLGEGGMGVVYLAEQKKPVSRRVALKVVKLGMDTREVIARFEVERQALALMSHPGIAKVFDAGVSEKGRPYFAMEYVPGAPITQHCDREQLSVRDRLRLFVEVCGAIQHAHQKGIIHRDLKPTNVLVSVRDQVAIPTVIDFGVAKATQQRLTEQTLFTEQGRLIGTPEYMSPEQAELTAQDIDTRTDVYALGVLLYELLTGALPFDSSTLRRASFPEIQRILRESDPPKPSTRLTSLGETRAGAKTAEVDTLLATVARARRADPRALARALRGDLDWIVMKCLEKDRARRYETASALAADIGRHLTNEPVEAGAPTTGYRLRKLVRRHRAAVVAASAVGAVLVAGVIASTLFAIRADRARAEAERQTAIAHAVNEFLNRDLLRGANPMQTSDADITMREVLDSAAAKVADRFSDQPEVEAAVQKLIADAYHGLGLEEIAERHAARALELQRVILGEGHPETLTTAASVGLARVSLGNTKGAVEVLERAVAGALASVGPENATTLQLQEYLARSYGMGGNSDQARRIYEGMTERMERVYGETHRGTVITWMNMGSVYRDLGRHDDAAHAFDQAYDRSVRGAGEGDYLTAMALQARAWAYGVRGEVAVADSLFRAGVDLARSTMGHEHPLALGALVRSARFQHEQGRHDEALGSYAEALEIGRRVMGPTHTKTLEWMDEIGRLYHDLGRHGEARETAVELIALRGQIAEENPEDADALNAYARLLLTCVPEDLRDPEAALPLALRCNELSAFEDTEHLTSLALARFHTGDPEAAADLQRKAIARVPAGAPSLPELENRLGEYEAAMVERGASPSTPSP